MKPGRFARILSTKANRGDTRGRVRFLDLNDRTDAAEEETVAELPRQPRGHVLPGAVRDANALDVELVQRRDRLLDLVCSDQIETAHSWPRPYKYRPREPMSARASRRPSLGAIRYRSRAPTPSDGHYKARVLGPG
jgi:hypothetical protein